MNASGSGRVSGAFAAVQREHFLTPEQQAYAGDDRPLPIGHGQTNSQPTTVRHMLELLDVQSGDRVLDVGSGSGWTTALLGWLTGATGRVIGVERVIDLVTYGQSNLIRYPMPWASIDQAESDTLGRPQRAPYDRILVSAEAERLPAELLAQLAHPGRMVIPVDGRLAVVDRDSGGKVTVRRVGRYAFVPLR